MTDFDADAVPKELRERDQWICWNSSTRNGKATKIPKDPDGGGGNAKSNDSKTWSTFEQAVETAEERGWGLGFVFTPVDPFVGIDIDSCIGDDGRPKDWSLDIGLTPFVNETFIETSPSGTGLHVYIKGEIPEWWTNQERDTQDGHEGVEVYEDGRFFTVTGDTHSFSESTVSEGDQFEGWLQDAWKEFNSDDTPPWEASEARSDTNPSSSETEDIDVDLYDVLRRTSYPEGERRGHPVHGSDTGSNFKVDEGAETFRCWRHQTTGNALHLVGMQTGIITCGEWDGSGLSSDTWNEIFDAARERNLDVGEKESPYTSAAEEAARAETDGGAATQTRTEDGSTDHVLSIEERVRAEVLTPVDPPEDYEGETIDSRVAVQRFTDILLDNYDFVKPREDVRGWRGTLYVYEAEEGIYEPHGEAFIEEEAERLLGSWVNNQQVNEIIGKIERRSLRRPGELDTEPQMLCVDNGILNLHTGELLEHGPDNYHRTKLDVRYDPSAECPRIDDFFHDIVDDSDVDTLYRLIAHCVYGEYAAEKAAMLVGDGQNGKSVLLSLVEEFLGSQNVSHRALQEFSDNDFAANDLEGKLANVHPDMGDEMVRDLGTFKKLTGRDTMTADVKYEKPVTFENCATLLFAANRMPVMSEDTHALWRRWIYLNFPYTFDDNDPQAKDETPKRVLMRELTGEKELEGLLARCVEEISEWYEGRAWFPDIMQPDDVREKMKRASEPVYDFAASCLKMGEEDDFIRKDKVREAYREYARQEGLPTKTGNTLGQKLLNLRDYPIESGQKRLDGGRATVYKGVTLTSRGRQVLGIDEDDENEDISDIQSKVRQIADITRELDDGDGVSKAMIIGRASSSMGMTTAERALEQAKERGKIQTLDGETFEHT